ncbi:hypothetical protein K0M31_007883 [Melipona bicolor]|uniref:Uncharacterized protein n=1 Tax=Melipona bicolor TaxID=60889 RepID=A0AA40GC76_9HYME|nr:hypothetical protein K0M31_007883 [Melipona bicolor]
MRIVHADGSRWRTLVRSLTRFPRSLITPARGGEPREKIADPWGWEEGATTHHNTEEEEEDISGQLRNWRRRRRRQQQQQQQQQQTVSTPMCAQLSVANGA